MAKLDQRAGPAAIRLVRRLGCSKRREDFTKLGNRLFRLSAQLVIEHHGKPPLCFAVEQGTFRHALPGHLLEAKRLRAELHLIGSMKLRFPALVLDRIGLLAGIDRSELHQVRDA